MRKLALILLALMPLLASAQYEEIIKSVKQQYAPDRRVAVWDITSHNDGEKCVIAGQVDNPAAKQALTAAFAAKGKEIINNVEVLPSKAVSATPWALARLPFVLNRVKPGHEYEMATQSLMGTPMRVLDKEDGWYRVQTPDNYISWVIESSLTLMSNADFNAWQSAQRYIVTNLITFMYETPVESENVASDLLLGDILVKTGEKKGWIQLATPDGRKGWAHSKDVQPLEEWAAQPFSADKMLGVARRMMGSTYTWGGMSPKGLDCSGLTKTCYFAIGIIIQRDASQQVLYGQKIAPKDWKEARPGDLLYFGTKSGRVTHTAIYEKDGYYIHSSGRVKRNSVDPDNDTYLTTPFLSINRIDGMVGTPGIVAAKEHKWYFK